MKIFIPILLLLLLSAISISQSLNSGDAIVQWLKIVIGFSTLIIAVKLLLEDKNSLRILLQCIQFAVLIFTAYAITQIYAKMKVHFEKGTPFVIDLEIASTLSNKNFYAEAIFLLLPFCTYGIFYFQKFWRWMCITNVLICLGTLAMLQTISTWIAFSVSTFFALIIFLMNGKCFFRKNIFSGISKVKTGIVLAIGFLILMSGVFLYSKTDNAKQLKKKISSIEKYFSNPELVNETSKINNNSFFERVLLWKNTSKLIQEHPLVGNGLANWKILIPKYGISGTDFINAGWVHYEHPHNEYFFIWSEQGIFSLLSYLLIFVFSFIYALKIIRRNNSAKENWLILFIFFGIAGFMVIALFAYPANRIYSNTLLMIQFAVVVSAYQKIFPVEKQIRLSHVKYFLLMMIILSSVALYSGVRQTTGEMHLKQILIAKQNSNFARVYRESEKAENYFYVIDIYSTPVVWYKGMSFFYSGKIREAKECFDKAEKINPYHVQVLNDLATCYEQTGDRNKAIELYERALKITPLFPDALLNLSAAYYNKQMYDSAFAKIDKTYSLLMSGQNKKSYATFFPPIISEYSLKVIQTFPDSIQRANGRTTTSDTAILHSIYREAKQKNISFEENLSVKFLHK